MSRLASLLSPFLVPLALGCIGSPPGRLGTKGFPIVSYGLPSGLRVVVEHDDSAQLVGMVWVIEAGTADEPADKPGLAHLVEHLLLRLPDENGVSTWARLRGRGATALGAGTTAEWTAVHALIRPEGLDELAPLLLARAADPLKGASEDQLARERRVIGQELELRRENGAVQGRRAVLSALRSAGARLVPSDGEARAALPSLSLADVRRFVQRLYRPERMTLVLSGAVPPDWENRLDRMLPPALLGSPAALRTAARRPAVPFAEPASRQRTSAIDIAPADVGARELWLGWLLPPARGSAELPRRALGQVVSRALDLGIDHHRLERWRMARESDLDVSSTSRMARALFDAWNMDWAPASLDDHPRDLAALKLDDVTTALAACRASAVVSIVGPDPPPAQ